MTFEDGAKASGENLVEVYGTLVFENAEDNGFAEIDADVKVTDDVSATYTNVYTAMSVAEDGDTVTVTRATVNLDASLTIKEGVTLLVPEENQLAITASAGITITINGVLNAVNGISGFDNDGDDKDTLVIAGEFITGEEIDAAYTAYAFGGAYYQTDESDGQFTHLTTLENAILDDNIMDDTVYIYGTATAGSIIIIGEADSPFVISVESGAVFTATEIDMIDAELNIKTGAKFTGTVGSADGAVQMAKIGGVTIVESDGLYVTGTVDDVDANSIIVSSGTVYAGTSDNPLNATNAESFTVSGSATLNVAGAMTVTTIDVQGTAVIGNSASLSAATVQVTGALSIAEKATTTASLGTLTVTSAMYVGIAASDVPEPAAEGTGAAATVTAPSDATVTMTGAAVYVAPGATVSDVIVASLTYKSTISVEGVEKFTIYVGTASTNLPDADDFKVSGAKVECWVDADGNPVEHVGDAEKVVAKLDYNVYEIVFVADYGVADIYLDGAKVAYVSAGEVKYVGTDDYVTLAYGNHTLEYTIKNGYNGDNAVTSFNGTSFTKTFTIDKSLSFEDSNEDAIVYKVVLSGVTQAEPVVPEQEKKDSTLTDALLIVLVVLIAIMAIMVALRLMRS